MICSREITPVIALNQPTLLGRCEITDAVRALSSAGAELRGAVFTRREVADFILDLTGYTDDKPLHTMRLLEPSFGGGDFLFPAADRLLRAWNKAHRPDPMSTLCNAITAVELHHETFCSSRDQLVDFLRKYDFDTKMAQKIVSSWLIHGDFLLAPVEAGFDFAIGNPPYIRQELIADVLMKEYRSRYRTIYDRADIYVPFIERSLTALRDGGQLGFICADRWMKNRYGGPLRKFVSQGYHLKFYVDMVGTQAFHTDVATYPAITVIVRENAGPTRVACQPAVEVRALSRLAGQLTSNHLVAGSVRELDDVTDGENPWILDTSSELSLVRRLEALFPTLEDAGCKVGIGVATGADKAFIGKFDDLDVEADRKLPLVMTRDIDAGRVAWRGYGVINPFAADGRLVDLDRYPKLREYLNSYKAVISGRHIAQKAPANWYRTIDRIYPDLAAKPKLLIPDIKGSAHVVYEAGELYPHHNLYFITADAWDLQALRAVLISGIARLFVAAYSTKMRGGFLRFQAQYLRRIRVPRWHDIPTSLRETLINAGKACDTKACNDAVADLYKLTEIERAILVGVGK